MEAYQTMQYGPTFPVDEAGKFLYEYNKRKKEIPKDNYQILGNKAYGLDSLLKADEKVIGEEIESIDFQIAEREKIKQRNVRFLEDQRQKLEGFLNQTECFTYKPSGVLNAVRGKLATQLVMVDLKKGEEYVTAFRDVQRLEEEKRKLLGEVRADEGWLG
jgi:hypothetical protein